MSHDPGVPGVHGIHRERLRQIAVHDYRESGDDKHVAHELVWAAIYYLDAAGLGADHVVRMRVGKLVEVVPIWPFETDPEGHKQPDIRCLEKAGALIAAEIDRRLRARSETS